MARATHAEINAILSGGIIHPGDTRPGQSSGDSPFEARLQSGLIATMLLIVLMFFTFEADMPQAFLQERVHVAAQEAEVQPSAVVIIPQATEAFDAVPAATTYAVKAGDTLWGLVGHDWTSVCQENRIENCNLIRPGQIITVPESFLSEKEKRNE